MGERDLTVLIADDEESIRSLLSKLLGRHGYRTIEAADGGKAFELYLERHPDIVITDIRMPGLSGLDLLQRIKGRTPDAFVAIMTGYGTEEVAIQAIRSGACNYFKKPFNASEFVYAVNALAELVRHRKTHEFDYGLLAAESKTIVMDSSLRNVYAVIGELTATLARYRFDTESVQIALLEMITNAVEHGNLRISLEEKQQALHEGALVDLYRQRAGEGGSEEKKVKILYEFSPSIVRYRISDEGGGFDWESLPDAGDPKNIMESSGRGIIMTRLLMDEVTYSDNGSAVTLVKKPRSE